VSILGILAAFTFSCVGVANAIMGLKYFDVSWISFAVLAVTIFGTERSFATSFLKPSRIRMSTSAFSRFLMMSFKWYFVVSTFLMIVSSLGATLSIAFAPALACRHVSFSLVSMVKLVSGMCLAVATL